MATLSTTGAETTLFHALSVDDALAVEHVEPLSGLSPAEVSSRRATYGPNRLVAEGPLRHRAATTGALAS
ncbi:cation-transporting P-type ATPase [Dactylosporangium salmoneum]|uniref:Cation-transporting P-type ATPase N-terminal domain-containing protein n=1 Tax=Dactylosporangium salmoneum TaxID=53361 RepID=A0ABP5SW04_9ACTN